MDINIFGKPFWLHGIEGTVYGLRKWSSTSVQTTGTTMIYETAPGVYSSSGPKITSATTQHQECWIKSHGGRDIKLEGTYSFADTQIARVVWGGLKGENKGQNVVVQNVSTGEGWTVNGSLPYAIIGRGVRLLTGQYILAILILSIMADAYWMMIGLPRNPFNNQPEYGDLPIPLIGITLFLGIIGFVHRNMLISSNHTKAMVIILKAISSNADFRKSLQN